MAKGVQARMVSPDGARDVKSKARKVVLASTSEDKTISSCCGHMACPGKGVTSVCLSRDLTPGIREGGKTMASTRRK